MEISGSEDKANDDCKRVEVVTGRTTLLVETGVLFPAMATSGWDREDWRSQVDEQLGRPRWEIALPRDT